MPSDKKHLDEVLQTLKEIKEDPDSVQLPNNETKILLKEIINIERKYMYGDKNLSSAQRKEKVQEVVDQHFDDKQGGKQ